MNSPRSAHWFNFGWTALVMTVLNAALLAGTILAAGDGVDSGIGVAELVLLLTVPVILVSLVLGIVGIFRRSGRTPAIISVALNTTALAVGVYGFLSTQVF